MVRRFKGPVQPGVSEDVFRETGESVPALPGEPGFIGPVRPPSAGGPGRGLSRAEAERRARALAEAKRLAEEKARKEAERKAREQRARAERARREALTKEALRKKIESQKKFLTAKSFELQQFLRAEANRRNVNISTAGAQSRFIQMLNRESRAFKSGEKEATGQERISEEAFKNLLNKAKGGDLNAVKLLGKLSKSKVFSFEEIKAPEKKGVKEFLKQLAIGELGKKFIGVQIRPLGFRGAVSDITARQIRTELRKRGLAGKTIATFIPTTPAEVSLFGGVAALGGGFGGKFLQVVTSATLTGLGLTAALTKKLPAEERIAGGLIALAGIISGASLLRFKDPLVRTKKTSKLSDLTNKIEVTRGKIKTPLSKTFQREVKFQINDLAVQKFVVSRLNKVGVNFNKLSKIEQNFVTGQVKAKIRTQPELFLPRKTQNLINRVRVRNLRGFTRKRLRGDFDVPISFRIKKVGKGVAPKLTRTQKLALKRFSERVEGQRLRKIIIKNLNKRLKNEIDLLTPKQKARIVSQIRAKIKADPTLTLSKAQKIALNKVKRISELEKLRVITKRRLKGEFPERIQLTSRQISQIKVRIRADPTIVLSKTKKLALKRAKRISELEKITGLTRKRLRGELPEKIQLTAKQKSAIKLKLKAFLKAQPEKFIPKQRRLALQRLRQAQEKKVIKRAIKKGARKLKPIDLLSKTDKIFFTKQIQARARARPEIFIPKTRQVALQVLKPKLKAKKIPVVEFKSKGLTSIQKLALKRQKQILTKVKTAQKIRTQSIKAIIVKAPKKRIRIIDQRKILNRFIKELQKQKKKTLNQKQILKQQQLSKQKKVSKLKTKLEVLQVQKSKAKTLTLLAFKQKQIQKFRQSFAQSQRELQGIKTLQKNIQKLEQGIKLISFQKELQRERQLKRLITKQKLIRRKPRKKIAAIRIKKIIRKKKPIKPVQVFNVFGKSKGKFIKLNIKPLTRNDALSKGTFAVDRTTAKTFKIVSAGKSKKPGGLLKGEGNYFKRQGFKLREFRIRRGRKFKLKNKYIEKRKFGIDTSGEKKGLTIARLLRQQRRGIRRKVKRVRKRKPITTKFKKSKVLKKRLTLVRQKRRVMGGRGRISKSIITKTKARKILREGKIRGKPLTIKQRGFFGARATGRPIKKAKRFIKGSKEAKAFMKKLRSKRR